VETRREDPWGRTVLKVTSRDAKPVTIKRIIFNNRPGIPGCDLRAAADPATCRQLKAAGALNPETDCNGYIQIGSNDPELKTGDTEGFVAVGCGDQIVMVDIYTDRESGGRRYTFH